MMRFYRYPDINELMDPSERKDEITVDELKILLYDEVMSFNPVIKVRAF
jgi:hypothetical protein